MQRRKRAQRPRPWAPDCEPLPTSSTRGRTCVSYPHTAFGRPAPQRTRALRRPGQRVTP